MFRDTCKRHKSVTYSSGVLPPFVLESLPLLFASRILARGHHNATCVAPPQVSQISIASFSYMTFHVGGFSQAGCESLEDREPHSPSEYQGSAS